ncbi:hypothetical protein QWA68_003705 [Fusarium oxysporum]|nr:hypothetical protein QWA68_003705 [Fusarium oxysporum]
MFTSTDWISKNWPRYIEEAASRSSGSSSTRNGKTELVDLFHEIATRFGEDFAQKRSSPGAKVCGLKTSCET